MTGSKRNPRSQSEHDREVKRLAKSYEERNYEVDADISGYKKPKSFGGYRPDIIVRKSGHETIVEVETTETKGSPHAKAQESAFKKARNRKPTRHFRLEDA